MKKTIALLTFASVLSACTPEAKVQMVPSGAAPSSEVTTSKNNTIEGTVNGGGGKGVLCKKNGQETLEILDLYEGRTLYGLDYSKKFNSLEEALQGLRGDYLQYFSEPLDIKMADIPDRDVTSQELIREKLDKEVSQTRNKIKFIEGSKNLKSTDDANEAVVEDDCESKQVALYYDENILLVDKKLWDKLDYLNQAALIYHEVIYKKARKAGEKDSVQSRRIVSHLFSDKGLRFDLGAPKDQVFVTLYGPLSFYIWEEAKNGETQVQMVSFSQSISQVFYGQASGLRVRATFKNKSIQDVLKFSTSPEGAEVIAFKDDVGSLLWTAEVFTDTIVDPRAGLDSLVNPEIMRLGTLEKR